MTSQNCSIQASNSMMEFLCQMWLTLVAVALLGSACSQQSDSVYEDPLFAGIWAQEEAIEECMRERGFEYVAFYDPAEDPAAVAAYPELANRAPLADPNDEIRTAMSDQERVAYNEALWGSSAFDPSGGGCMAGSIEEAYGFSIFDIIPDDAVIAEFELAVDQDPKMIAAEDAWRDCMAAGGYATDLSRYGFIHDINDIDDDYLNEAQLEQVDVSQLDGYAAFRAYYDGAYDVDLVCETDWIRVREEVRAKYRPKLYE